ncbi:unnamed protein product [Arabidopsis lyrata]|uniref:putative F-box protein At1g30925 isoform X1 n=1 Tax=Arabidopsis lyrata subsp. lyrata TaxID=81972 RepID=UPI000A29E977|nr:putative F-box protein At1g30925 isoform X1 [Arabidopsis lyrata subsp. lyrata]CAH8254075.1 unnamed protein product [Arabidopsis lyrata]|eukprot:XP_020870297.1 putative F-box protein At1g30925 isoform X1 [Arabidopsis lyrata subsp. lyrata]
MNREKTLDSIPIDLFLEIFSRLPTKSVGRCRCVSKQWASILVRQDFIELFLTKSSTRPRLLFAIQGNNDEWLFYSSPHPQNPYEKSTVVATDFHTKFPRSQSDCFYASGLLYFPDVQISKNKGEDPVPVICNPITGQYAILPRLRTDAKPSSFFGFDPIDKQFKVLHMNTIVNNEKGHRILTLGTGKMKWRKIQCPYTHKTNHNTWHNGICINGVFYYPTNEKPYKIVCFDGRSEKYKIIDATCFSDALINYKGKLCVIKLKYDDDCIFVLKLSMWVLEDVEKQEWSKYVYPFPKNENCKHLSVVGMTTTGEIVLRQNWSNSYFFYFSPERKTFQCVNFQGLGVNCGRINAFVDHVDDLSVNNAKQLKSSIYVQEQDRSKFESINKFDALCRLDGD